MFGRAKLYVLRAIGIIFSALIGFGCAWITVSRVVDASEPDITATLSSTIQVQGTPQPLVQIPLPTRQDAASPVPPAEAIISDTSTGASHPTATPSLSENSSSQRGQEAGTVNTIPRPPSASATSGVVGASDVEVVVEELFSLDSTVWPRFDTDTTSASYVNGTYRLELAGNDSVRFAYPLQLVEYEFRVDVQVEQGAAGVIFLQAEPVTVYQLLIRSDGKFIIQRVDENTPTNVSAWTASEALQAGLGATNRLKIERNGQRMQFFANDQPLTTFNIRAPSLMGNYGLVLSSVDGEARASFDNLRVSKLP